MIRTFFIICKLAKVLLTSGCKSKKAISLMKTDKTQGDKFVGEQVMNWAKNTCKVTDCNVTVIGEENIPQDRPCVFIANHQGMLDIPVLLGFINKPKAFIAKIEILKVPILSKWMKFMHCTFLDRKNPRQSINAMKEAIENVKSGYSIVIFPEGTRSKGGPIKNFKPGSFKLAFESEAPIVPVTIDGTWKIFEQYKRLRGADVKLTIHPVIETKGISKEQRLSIPGQVQNIISAAL